ncbi:hypothetical protein SLEP1_g1967 [Rubroshorea leprosula]|uniref:Uncharacterized protein n=1 Tax=Rubroshorea leprosula TaxID=152421 RepID=A0AAV5HFJ6_9ROSI|nr:hypothetical protein SLEP1_g1967 [Rubroshorea leprosula]
MAEMNSGDLYKKNYSNQQLVQCNVQIVFMASYQKSAIYGKLLTKQSGFSLQGF